MLGAMPPTPTTTAPTATASRFPILFTGANKAMVALGLGPSNSYVEVDDDLVRVRLGWSFALDVPRASISGARPDDDPVRGWGAHGWRGRWLVNGSSENLVAFDVDPPVRARLLVFSVLVRTLRVSVTEPEELIDALSS